MGDKVKYNVKNVHYAVLTEGVADSYGTPVAIPGAVSISLEPQGNITPFYADGVLYYQANKNNGYSGEFETAMFPSSFLKEIFDYTEGTASKVLTENAKKEPKNFALLFEEDGDTNGTKFVAYKCTATRPSHSLETTTDKIDIKTKKISLTISPANDGKVIAMTQDDTPAATLTGWYTSVFVEK